MKLQRVRIQNFRSIKDLEFKPSDLCALIGRNNCGKSNILKAINLVLGDAWPTVRSVSEQDYYGYDVSQDIEISLWFDEAREVRGDVGDPVTYSGVKFTVTRYQRKHGKHLKGDQRAVFVCVDDQGQAVKINKMTPGRKVYPTPASVTTEVREALPAVFIDIDRNARHHLSGSQWSILGRLLADVSKKLKADAARYKEFRQRFDEARKALRTKDFDELEKKVVSHLRAHTGIEGVTVMLDDLDPINLYRNFSVLFKDPETPQPVDAERMGSGIQSAVVISLLQAYRELRKENAILLFEEPELFLHPHGRRHLYDLLRKLAADGTQVIYTTHSQDFVELTELEQVQFVVKTLEAGTTSASPTGVVIDEDLKKRLNAVKHLCSPRNEVFFADSVVLVEGPTEVAVIRRLADLMPGDVNLDRLNCSVIEVGGKPALPIFIRIMRAMGKRILVVYDSDSHLTSEHDLAVNTKRCKAIQDEMTDGAAPFVCVPHIEAVAGLTGDAKESKETRMRLFLENLATWDAVPTGLRSLMDRVTALTGDANRGSSQL